MGARGPKPLPANVHALRGNPSKLPLGRGRGQLGDTVEPEIDIPDCPTHLLPVARKEWRRITPQLEALGLISHVDRAALGLYCQEWAWWVWHDRLLQRDVKLAAERLAAHEASEEIRRAAAEASGEVYEPQPFAGGDGFRIPTPNGNWTYNPHWVARHKSAAALDKYLASFGLSPSSRGRVSPSSRQPYLPGLEPPKGGFDAL